MIKSIIVLNLLSLFNIITLNQILNGVFYIGSSIYDDYNLMSIDSSLYLRTLKAYGDLNNYYFRLNHLNSNIYFIESIISNKRLALADKTILKFIEKNDTEYITSSYWNLIKLKNDQYLIQNNETKNFLESGIDDIKCITDITNKKNISSNFKFIITKLYEEPELDEESLSRIEEEPIDVVIKYIDLSDKKLNRTGIPQITKDEDNGELRYSVRSIFENIPWFRKIIIVMPNDKVKYFKSPKEIKERIVYIKDKDVIGFDTASNPAFHFRLWNLSRFNVSENIILMDDDYFIGKPIKKSDFFYYDKKKKKVFPNIVSVDFRKLNKKYVYEGYERVFANRDKIDPHTTRGWKLHTLSCFKFLFDCFKEPLIDAGFTHNAIPLNILDVKEIFDLIQERYIYADKLLNSKVRSVYDIQFQTFYMAYALNIKKRKAKAIPRSFIELKKLRKKSELNVELFVINTSGDNNYSVNDFDKMRFMLEEKFRNPTKYEILQFKNNIINIKSIVFVVIINAIVYILIIFILKLHNINIKFKFSNFRKISNSDEISHLNNDSNK